jgi:hypothetical protein
MAPCGWCGTVSQRRGLLRGTATRGATPAEPGAERGAEAPPGRAAGADRGGGAARSICLGTALPGSPAVSGDDRRAGGALPARSVVTPIRPGEGRAITVPARSYGEAASGARGTA